MSLPHLEQPAIRKACAARRASAHGGERRAGGVPTIGHSRFFDAGDEPVRPRVGSRSRARRGCIFAHACRRSFSPATSTPSPGSPIIAHTAGRQSKTNNTLASHSHRRGPVWCGPEPGERPRPCKPYRSLMREHSSMPAHLLARRFGPAALSAEGRARFPLGRLKLHVHEHWRWPQHSGPHTTGTWCT